MNPAKHRQSCVPLVPFLERPLKTSAIKCMDYMQFYSTVIQTLLEDASWVQNQHTTHGKMTNMADTKSARKAYGMCLLLEK